MHKRDRKTGKYYRIIARWFRALRDNDGIRAGATTRALFHNKFLKLSKPPALRNRYIQTVVVEDCNFYRETYNNHVGKNVDPNAKPHTGGTAGINRSLR
jgi:hypothetical protein